MKEQLEKIILNKIKENGLKPKSKFYFIFKNISFWVISILFIGIGGIAFASVLYKISDNLYVLNNIFKSNLSFGENLFYLIPYFWLIILIIFLLLAIQNFKKTNFSYRYNLNTVILLMLGAAGTLGLLIFYLGFSQKTEELSMKYIPFYKRYEEITNIKKNVFLKKIKNLGITNNILKNNPELKKEVEKKFYKNVLGKNYIYKNDEKCLRKTFKCENDEIFFKDNIGCGCREIYINLKLKK